MIRGKVKSQVLMSTSKPRSVLGLIIQSTTIKANKSKLGETQVCTLEQEYRPTLGWGPSRVMYRVFIAIRVCISL